ncbi:MAG: hypothetical protein ACXAAN_16630 [Candidatus Thorarchaeota archaeon]|jgi:hypothetical protein
MIITGVSDSIPMELYFERYVQTAAREGYSDDEFEETEIPEFDVRIVMFFIIAAAGGLSILLVVIYPRITKKFSKPNNM